jgi:hypothetical protein
LPGNYPNSDVIFPLLSAGDLFDFTFMMHFAAMICYRRNLRKAISYHLMADNRTFLSALPDAWQGQP